MWNPFSFSLLLSRTERCTFTGCCAGNLLFFFWTRYRSLAPLCFPYHRTIALHTCESFSPTGARFLAMIKPPPDNSLFRFPFLFRAFYKLPLPPSIIASSTRGLDIHSNQSYSTFMCGTVPRRVHPAEPTAPFMLILVPAATLNSRASRITTRSYDQRFSPPVNLTSFV